MRVFISSTCYDLSLLRSQLRSFIKNMCYEPIMSDYEDILYDPRIHTHTSCVDEVKNCDVLILIIGSRFGGKATPEALNKIDFESLQNESANVEALKETKNLSVTQLEVLQAIECGIPVYTFVDKRVWHDHALYEKNKSSDIIGKIIFPSIEKQETAKFIFNFINFVRLRTKGNNIFTFEKGQDIEDILKKQWSGYFQRLLQEERFSDANRKKIDVLGEQFEDLKTAILSSIENVDQREIARAIVRYRRLSDLLFGLDIPQQVLYSFSGSLHDLFQEQHIQIVDAHNLASFRFNHGFLHRTFFIKEDQSFYELRFPSDVLKDFETEWTYFKQMKPNIKNIVLDTFHEMYRPNFGLLRYHRDNFNDFLERNRIKENDDEISVCIAD